MGGHMIRTGTPIQAELDLVKEQLQQAQAELELEQKRRVYYQDIVYSVCRTMDRLVGRKVQHGQGIVCGTKDTPTDNVQVEMKRIAVELQQAQAELEHAKADVVAFDEDNRRLSKECDAKQKLLSTWVNKYAELEEERDALAPKAEMLDLLIEIDERAFVDLTMKLPDHPENYDGPCYCELCQSYGD